MVDTVVGMTNAEGGWLFIGIDDDGKISGVRSQRWHDPMLAAAYIASHTVPPVSVTTDLVKAEGVDVMIIRVPKSAGIVASNDGRILKRRLKIDGTPETSPLFPQEFIARLSDIGRYDYTAAVLPNAACDDIDALERDRLRRYILENHGESALLDLENDDLDKVLGLARETPHGLLPTVAGLLLIGRKSSLQRLLPGAGAVFQHLSGTEVLANEELDLPLLSSFAALLERFKARNSETEIESGLTRLAVPGFSERAFREALVNAFCHRDYTLLNRVSVRFSDDGLEITSPGGFVSGVSLGNLLTVEPHPRNALLADIFKRLGLAERTGRGIDRIFEGSLLYGRPSPDYSESTEESVRVFFPRCEANLDFFKCILDYQKRTERRISIQGLMVLSALLFSKSLTLAEIEHVTHLPALRLKRHVETLLRAGLLASSGNGENRDFVLATCFDPNHRSEDRPGRPSERVELTAEDSILQFLKEKGRVTRGDVMAEFHLSAKNAYRLLRKLVDSGKLVREGERRGTVYRLSRS